MLERRASGVFTLRLFAACLLQLALLMPDASLAGSTPRTEVAIFPHRLSNGDMRFVVSVQVGGVPIKAMLDTGSFGLRVMARVLAPSQYEATDTARDYGYGSGVVLSGPLARAVVAIGGATTGNPITMQVVQSVSCSERKPNCPASRLAPADYRLGGDGLRGEGFDAILGLSMRGSDAPVAANNPLSAMGSRRWIVILPQPGATAPGLLIINPDAADLTGFRPVLLGSRPSRADGTPQVKDLEIPSCPDRPLDEQQFCPLMKLDSGAGRGVRPFYSYAVLYDAENKAIALKQR